jgi:hypothetical protein
MRLIAFLVTGVLLAQAQIRHLPFAKPLDRFNFVLNAVQALLDPTQLLNEDGRAIENSLIGIYSNACAADIEGLAVFIGAQRASGPDVLRVLKWNREEHPELAGIFPDLIRESCSILAYISKEEMIQDLRIYRGRLSNKEAGVWIKDQTTSTLSVINQLEFPVTVSWVCEGKPDQSVGVIQSGDKFSVTSHLGHIFTVRKLSGELVDFFKVTHARNTVNIGVDLIQREVSERSLFEFAHDHQIQQRRAGNYFQPQLVPAITPVGFEKIRVPEQLFKDIRRFFDENEPRQRIEFKVGPCVNQEVAPTFMIDLDPILKKRIIDELQPILESWAGLELEPTSLYGRLRIVSLLMTSQESASTPKEMSSECMLILS